MPSLFYAGQPDYIEKLNTLATAASMTNGTVAASFLSLAVTGTATAASFVGPLTGNASTATTLATARNINGVSFNGSADITVTAAAGTLTGNTLAAGVTASSLTSVGTLTALTVSGQSNFAAGTAAAPSVKVGAEQNGLYSSAANTLDVTLGGVRQFQFARTASAVNYAVVYGAATGARPLLLMTGSDTNIGINISSKGTGDILFTGGSASYTLLQIAGGAAGTVNYPLFTASTTGNYIGFSATGTDTNIGITYTAKGAGTHDYYVRNGVNFRVSASTDNAINYFTVTGQATGLGPLMLAGGSDTNVTARYRTQGTGSHQFETGSSGNIALLLAHVASSVNYAQFSGNSAGGYPSLRAAGSDTNVGFDFSTQGTAPFRFYTAAFGAEQFRVASVASAVNYLQAAGGTTGNEVRLSVQGSDTNAGMWVTTKGNGVIRMETGGGEQFRVTHTASAVNYWSFTGAATTNGVRLDVTGSDSGVNAFMVTKGIGVWNFCTGSSSGNRQLQIGHVASAVNYLYLTGAATGNAVTVSAAGSDSNIDFAITPKGTGNVRFGTHSAIAAETVTGYITIKDSAGNTRKLAVLS